MKRSDKNLKKKFLQNFCSSSEMSSFKKTFLKFMGRKIECVYLTPDYKNIIPGRKRHRHVLHFLNRVRRNAVTEIKLFKCSCDKDCLFIPVSQGDNIYGYILALHLQHKPDRKDIAFIKLFINSALKEFQKEQELNKLYDTIRPRAIALSTIHTIHRLLSSTLDMDELIERITRLTSQVMRATYCSILLLDDSKKRLVPKAVIDLRNSSTNLHKPRRKIRIGFKLAEKVARTGRARLTHRLICVPLVEEDVIGVIFAGDKDSKAPFNQFDMEILLTLAEQAVIAIKNAQLYEGQRKMALGTIKSLAVLLDVKSPQIYTHSEQFVKLVLAIAEQMKLPKEEVENLRYAALLPDTGRFTIPEEILKKQGNLSPKEYNIIRKRHLESLKILEPLEFLKPVMPIIIYHHERYDGTGYPEGLKGQQIPVGARIMAVADAFEAMVSSRPYKERKVSVRQALKEIRRNRGSQFDPEVVDALMTLLKRPEYKDIFNLATSSYLRR